MTKNEIKVLSFLARSYSMEGFGYLPFAPIAKATRLPRRTVRLACRSLARKGLTAYGNGLWTDDGELAGAGYCCSEKGRALLREMGFNP